MAQNKPTIPQGTRDFGPAEMVRRNYIFDTIRNTFKLYGYQPLETPALENLSTLLGKYGEEGDKLLFRILNSGDFMSKVPAEALAKADSSSVSSHISERGMKYDLTVPFARYVVQNQGTITFPFKRYQIQPVWRADRPQKGRYREFYQCDVDVIGSNSLFNEVELLQIISHVFKQLNLDVVIKLNNRKILAGIAETIGFPEKMTDITVAIDKLDKIGGEKVNEELLQRGLSQDAINKLQPVLSMGGSNSDKLNFLQNYLVGSETGKKGIEEIKEIFDLLATAKMQTPLELDLTLARGLNYYTGAIIEVKTTEMEMGSICGGGRYDDLTGIFGLKGVSGVGVSFGADRIYDVLQHTNKFPETIQHTTQVLFTHFGRNESVFALPWVYALRNANISCELYPDAVKLGKQMTYADKKGIPYVALVGENEMQKNTITLKNMQSGVQEEYTLEALISFLSN